MGIKVADVIKVANHLTLRSGYYPGLPKWVSYNHRDLNKRREKAGGPESGKVM